MSEEEISVDMVMKSTDPAFKLFGRRIPVVSGSESTTERSSDSTTDSSEVTKFMKSSFDDAKSSVLFERTLGCKGEMICWDEENTFFSNAVEIGNKLDGGMHLGGDMSGMEKVGEQKLEMGVQENDTQNQENITQNPEPSIQKIGDDAHNIVGEGCEEGSNETGNKSGDEVPKKPNKVLPCPRCESMDTKFCYYNNYNVNQPRHFCRNCQRYWTAGGLLRNVPVGAGRRKNKHSVGIRSLGHGNGSDCPNGNSEESVKFEVSDLQMGGYAKKEQAKHLGIPGLFAKDNENLQKSRCVLNQNGENIWNASWPSCHDNERGESGEFPCTAIDDSVCASSNTKLTKSEMESYESNNTPKDQGGVCCQLPNSSASWVSGPPPIWPMYCGNVFGNSPYMGGAMMTPESLQATAMMPWFQPCPGFPWAFPSVPMWAQTNWGPAWGMPLRPQSPSSTSLDGSSSMLGKHTRDLAVPQSDANGDGSIWVPKTLRIDDPEEAAKSSIWTTLGLGSKPESITSGGIFKAFQPKTENKDNTKSPAHVLSVNPAASTRSASFNEST